MVLDFRLGRGRDGLIRIGRASRPAAALPAARGEVAAYT